MRVEAVLGRPHRVLLCNTDREADNIHIIPKLRGLKPSGAFSFTYYASLSARGTLNKLSCLQALLHSAQSFLSATAQFGLSIKVTRPKFGD